MKVMDVSAAHTQTMSVSAYYRSDRSGTTAYISGCIVRFITPHDSSGAYVLTVDSDEETTAYIIARGGEMLTVMKR